MATDSCRDCNGEFVWDADAGSGVCLNCGLLENASQVVLDSHVETEENGRAYDNSAHASYTRSTLKSLRSRNGWDLPGQGKAAALERNKNVMKQFTTGLARRIGHPGLYPRAQYLFDQALERGHIRWGRKARLVAGAALAIALREAHKGETIKDIAFLLEESPVAVARVFTRLMEWLEIKLTSFDPTWHLPVLRKRFVEILEHTPPLPPNLLKVLKSLHLPSVLRTASSLSDLVSRAGSVANLPSPPTACAIFILAMEGEALTSLPKYEHLAKMLGVRFGVSGDVIMRRYKIISDQVQLWSQNIPWIKDEAAAQAGKKTKVARRVAIARSLKDVVHFQEGIWQSAFEASGPLTSADVDDEGSVSTASEVEFPHHVDHQGDVEVLSRARKRRKLRCIEDASDFLLRPLHSQPLSRRLERTQGVPSLDTLSHILAADSPSFNSPATRLQLLSLSKGADDITDDELFGEGELESFWRTQEERDALASVLNWTQAGEINEGAGETEEERTDNNRTRDLEHGSISRINIEALNRLLAGAEVTAEIEACYDDDNDEWAGDFTGVEENTGSKDGHQGASADLNNKCLDDVASEAVEIEPWRPLSPGRGTQWNDSERYEDDDED